MNFSENELLRKDRKLSFLGHGETGKRVLEFQANFSKVFGVLASKDSSNLASSFPTLKYAARGPAAER